jgi:RHS repeat-associated protein
MAGSNPVAQYTYDAFGQRVMKVGAVSGTTFYQYDPSGHLLEETDGQGNAQVDYIYLGSLAVATLSPSAGQVYFLHDDRLGAPQLATDSGQSVAWLANYGPFGEMSAVPAGIVQNLRLPGQEFDVDTGLYHNGFRDYAPGWGRYQQSDPLGLLGGMNTYAYAAANPLNRTDPLGLDIVQVLGTDFKVGYQSGGILGGINGVINGLSTVGTPQCLVAAAKFLQSEEQAIGVALDIKDAYDFLKSVADAAAGDALAIVNVVSKVFQWGAQNSDCWGATCKPGINPNEGTSLNWDQPAQPGVPAKP